MKTLLAPILLSLAIGACTPANSTDAQTPATNQAAGLAAGRHYRFIVQREFRNSNSSWHALRPTDPIPDSEYRALAHPAHRYDLGVSADGQRVELTAIGTRAPAMSGGIVRADDGTVMVDFDKGTFAGGMLVVKSSAAPNSELTIFGSGVPLLSREVGTLEAVNEKQQVK